MEDKIKSIIFLFMIPFVAGFSTYGLVVLHVENLPDPLNVIVVLSVGFIPPVLMLWYWLQTFYFKNSIIRTG